MFTNASKTQTGRRDVILKSSVSTAGHCIRRKRNPVLHLAAIAEIAVVIIILPKYVCRKENHVTHPYMAYWKVALATQETQSRLSNCTPPKPSQPYTNTKHMHHGFLSQCKLKAVSRLISRSITCNVIRKSELKGTEYERRIKPSPHVLKMYNNSTLTPFGKCKIQVRDPTTTKKFKVPFTIVDDHHVKNNLLGCRTLQQLDLIRVVPSTQVNQVSGDIHVPHPPELTLEDIQETYPDIFEGLGTLQSSNNSLGQS